MVRHLIYIVSFLFLVFVPPAQAEPVFFSTMRDMPLMPGLTELPDQAVIFDKAEGRIIESVAQIDDPSTEEVRSYYGDTLPQLGWTRVEDSSYVRGSEQLSFNFENIAGHRFFRIMIEPR